MKKHVLALAPVMAAVLALTPAVAAHADTPPWRHDLGEIPLTAPIPLSGAVAEMPGGEQRGWLAVNGQTAGSSAYLAQIDLATSSVVAEYPLPGAGGAWGVDVAPNGDVYVSAYLNAGSATGNLYRLPYGGSSVTNLGNPTGTSQYLWQSDIDELGRVYVGSFEGTGPGHVGRYDPATGTWHDYGTLGSTEAYVRTVHVIGDTIYAGTGSQDAGLYAINRNTGVKQKITIPSGAAACEFGYETSAVGTKLFVVFAGCGATDSIGYIYDTVAGTWSNSIGRFAGQDVSNPDSSGKVYLINNDELQSYTVSTGAIATTGAYFGWPWGALGISVLTDPVTSAERVVALTHDGSTWSYDIATGVVTPTVISGLSGSVGPIVNMGLGPGANGHWAPDVYVSTTFRNFAGYNPITEDWTTYPMPTQVQGMGEHDGKLYLATYTGSEFFEFDPASPWDYGTNPRKLFDLRASSQDRPYVVQSAGDYVAMGTVPAAGVLGGSLALYDPATDTHREFANLVQGQSITALAYRNGVLYGATSVYGGVGATPTATQAVVFAFNPVTGVKLWQTAPLAEAKAITGLSFDANGDLWGATIGKVFKMDIPTISTTYSYTIQTVDWSSVSNYWSGSRVIRDPNNGLLYVTTQGNMYTINPATSTIMSTDTDCSNLVFYIQGDKFCGSSTSHLWQARSY